MGRVYCTSIFLILRLNQAKKTIIDRYFNRKYGRVGPLFQSRFKSHPEEGGAVDSVSLENTATMIQTGVTAIGRNLWTKMRTEDNPAWVARKSADIEALKGEVNIVIVDMQF